MCETIMSDSPLRALGSSGGKDEVDRPIVALKFKLAKHQRTVGVAARLPRQREGMEDKVGAGADLVLLSCVDSVFSCVCARPRIMIVKKNNSNPDDVPCCDAPGSRGLWPRIKPDVVAIHIHNRHSMHNPWSYL